MGGFSSKAAIVDKAMMAVLNRTSVTERALKNRAESMQIIREELDSQRVSLTDVNEFVSRLIDLGLVEALMQSFQDLRSLKDGDTVIDNVVLNVQTLALLGKFIESQEKMDSLDIITTLKEKVITRYSFDEGITRDLKNAIETISGTKEAETDKLAMLYSKQLSEFRANADALGVLQTMHQASNLPEVQKLCVKELYRMLDKNDNRKKLSQFDSLQKLLGMLVLHEGNALVCYTGLVILTEIASNLSDGDLGDLGKNKGCSFAVKQLYMHQESNVDLCQQALWLINALCRVDANVRVLHGVGGLAGINAALQRNPRKKGDGDDIKGLVLPQKVIKAVKRMEELEEEFAGLEGYKKSAN